MVIQGIKTNRKATSSNGDRSLPVVTTINSLSSQTSLVRDHFRKSPHQNHRLILGCNIVLWG